MKKYSCEIIEHTADIGIRVKSATLEGLFKRAGLAIVEISTQKQNSQYPRKHKIAIKQSADNLEELFINWLNELLSLSAVEALIFEDIEINHVNEHLVDAVVIGSDIRNYKINTEIKAATYHQLKVEKSGCIWQAKLIFDV